MIIYLIGLPGSGKSTLGKLLAHKINYEYVDMDDEICRRESRTIESIFAAKGENYFRELEHEVLHETFALTHTIVSTGGGAPCFFDNMQQMNRHGLTLYIKPSVQELSRRLSGQGGENRPMLKGKSSKQVTEFLEARLKERSPYYEQAEITFSSDMLTAEQVFERIQPYL